MPKKVGLYFGTFNPFHVGHLIIANHLVQYTDLEEVWLVVTPQSPFKKRSNLLANHHRLELVYRAVEDYDYLKACDIEFKMPQPNYTAMSLAELSDQYPELDFSIIMGEDNLKSFHKWKNWDYIIEQHQLYICPRIAKGELPEQFINHPKITWTDTPIIELSSTLIRSSIKAQKVVEPMLPPKVWQYIDEMNFYRT